MVKAIKPIYEKIWQNLMIDLDQKMKVRIKKTFESVNVLYEGR